MYVGVRTKCLIFYPYQLSYFLGTPFDAGFPLNFAHQREA